METKLVPPPARSAQVIRRDLLDRLDTLSSLPLTVVAAPTGFGKTTLLATWARGSEKQIAWVSLDPGDDDPGRLMRYVVTALVRTAPELGKGKLRTLRPVADPLRSTVPRLTNEVARLTEPVVLVLDDCHALQSPASREVIHALVRDAPAQLRLVLVTRTDAPVPVGRLRARGELGELRAEELRFSPSETRKFLVELLGLPLDSELVSLLGERTEGWPAGLYLAALSLRGRNDQREFVTGFAGSNRHVVDYLGAEVLAAQPDDVRAFLLRTSVLRRLSGPLCDAVLEEHGSGARLAELERSNLFLVPLDEQGEWYRYHRLFGELLYFELANESPELIPALHGRAADWHCADGEVADAVAHALAAGDVDLAAASIARRWQPLFQFGQYATVQRLLGSLPPRTIERSVPLSFVAAALAGLSGASQQAVEAHLNVVEGNGWVGALPDGTPSVEVAAAFVRAVCLYGDVGRTFDAADRLVDLAGDHFLYGSIGRLTRARALYLQGDLEGARGALPSLGGATAWERPTMSVYAGALRSLIELEAGNSELALALARSAVALADELGIAEIPILGLTYTALGSALAASGELIEAERALERALEQTIGPPDALPHAHVALALATVRAKRGDPSGARQLLLEARSIIEKASDPGVLASRLDALEHQLIVRSRREVSSDDLPTERELRVLRLLASGLTQAEIASELYLTANTIKSHKRALYRKLGASSRDEAVARARALGLL